MRAILIILLITMVVFSCSKETKNAERIVDSEGFHTLTVDNRFDIILTQGAEESISVSGHPALIEKVFFEINDGELRITSTYNSAWLRPKNNRVKIYITVVELKKININETGSLICTNELVGDEIGLITTGKLADVSLKLNCNTFYCWNNFPCGGKVNLSGECDFLKIWNYALMQVDAVSLLANSSLVENFSKGDVTVSTQNQLVYRIVGEGNIFENGDPIDIDILSDEGIGKLIFL